MTLSSWRKDARHRRRSQHRFALERLEQRCVMAGLPFGAMPDDTAEFMLGEVYVKVVLMESSAAISPTNNNSETWTPATIAAVKQKITDGLQWWEDTLATKTNKHTLNFQIDFTNADSPITTSYEPITRASTDFQFWIYDFLNVVGFNNRGNFHSDIRAYNNAQRLAKNADWAYTIFVVNDTNDADKQFAPGGFSRAFAFSGGEFLVSPAARPASTYSHETGHIFWAFDEYNPDGQFDRVRGYYGTQNLNAWNNPTAGFVQQPSIMTKDSLLDTAFTNHTSAPSTLEFVGWKDSDGDGVFDVLDVPLTLTGSGAYDLSTGRYRFVGSSAVQTLPNKNPSGLKNDITINKVSRAQFRIDGGAWQTAATYGTPAASLDLSFSVANTASSVEIRTIDDVTGVTSTVYSTVLSRPASVLLPGINGVVWRDADRDGTLDFGERGLADVTVQLVDANGAALNTRKLIEPDNHASTTRLNNVLPEVTLSAEGGGVTDDSVVAFTATNASTGNRVFASRSASCGSFCADWTTDSRRLRMDFTDSISTLSIDAIGSSLPGVARLEVFGANNQLLERATSRELSEGQKETLSISRALSDIKFAIAHTHNNTIIHFDNLRFGPDASAATDANGTYAIPYVGAGEFRAKVVAGPTRTPTNPASGQQMVLLAPGEAKGGVDFGLDIETSIWQNQANRFDVNRDTFVTAIDVLLIINEINGAGARALGPSDPTPPFIDVDGDKNLAPVDALLVINEINSASGGGEGSGQFTSSGGGHGSAAGEYSAVPVVIPATVAEQFTLETARRITTIDQPSVSVLANLLASSVAADRFAQRPFAAYGEYDWSSVDVDHHHEMDDESHDLLGVLASDVANRRILA